MIQRARTWLFLLFLKVMALLGLCLGSFACMAQDRAVDICNLGSAPLSLTAHFSVLEDRSLALTLEDMARPAVASGFKADQPPGESLNFGRTDSAHWLKLSLKNNCDQRQESMLEITYPRLAASVQFHQPDGQGGYRSFDTGYLKPFVERPYQHHFFVFPVALDAHSEQVLYLRFQSPNTIEIPARLWSRDAFHAYERSDYMFQSLYFGMVLAMVAFNLLLFIALRDYAYLMYVAFVCCIALTVAANNGLANEYLWRNAPALVAWVAVEHAVGFVLSMATLLLFMRRMLSTRTLLPRLDRTIKLFIVWLALLAVACVVSFPSVRGLTLLTVAAASLLILFIGFMGVYHRQRSARFFLAAFSVMCLSGFLKVLREFGFIGTNILTLHGIQLGSAIEMLVLAFALADRFNVLRMEKAKAQTEALQAQQRMVENLQNSERMLEGRVSERTAELSATIAQLRQTQADLVQAEKLASLGALVAGVAHELNTPIGTALTVSSSIEAAATELDDLVAKNTLRRSDLTNYAQKSKGMAELVSRCCERAASLIQSFKQVAVDQTSEERRVFDLRALVEDNIAALRPSIGQQPWVISTHIPADIRCDSYPGPLGQVIAHLVRNAVTHGFAGRASGQITVSARVRNAQVEMQITDDGSGMEPAVLAHIFEPFYTTRLGQGGSGLGLSIARNLVTGVLKGTLSAQSAPEQGSTFSFTFPLDASPLQPATPA